MGIGLGGLVGGIVGGVAGFAGGGGPLGAMAGFSAGTALGGSLFDENGEPRGDLDAERLAMAREQKEQWDKVYGPIQEKIAKNLRNMSLASVSALGLEGVEQEFEAAGIKIRQSVAQRGLEGSGLEQEFKARSAITAAEAKADIRADAPEKIAAAQRGFLSLGLAEKDRGESLESRLLGEQARREEASASSSAADLGRIVGTAGKVLGRTGLFDKDKKDKPSTIIKPTEPTLRTDEPRDGETLV